MRYIKRWRLRADDLAGTQATGAGVDVLRRTINNRLHAFDVGTEDPVGTPVRMGDLNAELDLFSADIAFCHALHLLTILK